MLTILAPLEIKAKTSYIRDPESFYHRIVGNYSLMETHIDQEDLLHITATPPEIYVSEGEGMTSILSQNERNETNINKVNILNNVLNRIVVSADANLTYQDRVFITDALYRFGIRDDRRFMEAFYEMAQETRNTNTLINLYLEKGGELGELVEEIKSYEKESVGQESTIVENRRENFLYNSVMKRLQTGAIYQIVSNFNRTVENNEIDAGEYSLSNQNYTAQHILLSVLRERAGVSADNMIFLSGNTYEESVENTTTEVSSVRNEITAAVMMDILKNIYHTGFDRFYLAGDTYYRFEDVFFKSSDQTFMRLLNSFQSNYTDSIRISEYLTENNMMTNAEIELLSAAEPSELSEEEVDELLRVVSAIDVQNEKIIERYTSEVQRVRDEERRLVETGRVTETELENITQTADRVLTGRESERVTDRIRRLELENLRTTEETTSEDISTVERQELVSNISNIARQEIESLTNTSQTTLSREETERIRDTENRLELENLKVTDESGSEVTSVQERQELVSNISNIARQEIESLTNTSQTTLSREETERIRDTENRLELENLKVTDESRSEVTIAQERQELVSNISNIARQEIESLTNSQTVLSREETQTLREKVRSLNLENLKVTDETRSEVISEKEIKELVNSISSFTRRELEFLSGVRQDILTEEERSRLIEVLSTTGVVEELRRREYLTEIQSFAENVKAIDLRNEERRRQYTTQTLLTKQDTENITETENITDIETEHVPSGEHDRMTDEEIRRITEAVNQMNVQNEMRRRHYVQEIQKIRERHPVQTSEEDRLEMTRKDGVLALTNPEKLVERLQERREQTILRQNTIIQELQNIFPDQSMEVYQMLSRLREGDVSLIENNILRPADVGELIYDINTANEPTPEERKAKIKADAETAEFMEAVRRAREEEKAGTSTQRASRGPVETIHRQNETLTTEELNEQLDLMQSNISRQINRTVDSTVVTENHVRNSTQVVTNENVTNTLSRRDIEQLVENGVKSRMNTLSNQVMNKIEKQMRNEKMRRGY